jgi:hypothetical protein
MQRPLPGYIPGLHQMAASTKRRLGGAIYRRLGSPKDDQQQQRDADEQIDPKPTFFGFKSIHYFSAIFFFIDRMWTEMCIGHSLPFPCAIFHIL